VQAAAIPVKLRFFRINLSKKLMFSSAIVGPIGSWRMQEPRLGAAVPSALRNPSTNP
jgi:hypothetical protein